MRDKTRNAVRAAAKHLRLVEDLNADEFCDFYNDNVTREGLTLSYDRATLLNVCDESVTRRRGRILAARHHDGRLAAAIVYIWDARASYYLLTTRTREAGNGAVSLLIWEAIKDSTKRGLIFDFDGVATFGSRLFFVGFGGAVVPRYIVRRYSAMHRVIDKALSKVKMRDSNRYL